MPEKLEKFNGIVGLTLFLDGVPHHSCRLCGTARRLPDLQPAKRFKGFSRITVEKKPPLYGMKPNEVEVCIPRWEKFSEVCGECRVGLEKNERERRSKSAVTAQRRRQASREYF